MSLILAVLACGSHRAPPVEARMLFGSVQQVRLQESGLADLGACAARAERRGEIVGGEVEVQLQVLQGRVLGAELVDLPGDSERLGLCIERRAARWRFPDQIDGEIHAGATIQAERPPSRVVLTDDAAVQRILGHYPEIRACYEDRLLGRPELRGRLGLRLQVQEGVVSRVEFTGEELADDVLRQCVAEEAQGWAFEPERSGVVATEILLVP